MALVVAASVAALAAAGPRARPIAACGDARLRACLARLAKPRWSAEDLRAFFARGGGDCFASAQDDPRGRLRQRQARCLPVAVGADARNGKTLELRYFCSDVCPDQGAVFLIYAGVDRDQCCALGGRPLHDPAWGAYRGCMPPEAELPILKGHACPPATPPPGQPQQRP
jgi:hypothetical protein